MSPANSPAVSVVIPALDARASIGAALASVLAERDVGVEVLVVDDGSTDGTAEYVRDHDDTRVRLLSTNERRSGPSHARNIALTAARGQWIAFLDADDWWMPGRLPRLLSLAAQGGAEMVADDVRIVYGDQDPASAPTLFELRGLQATGGRPLTLETLIRHDLGPMQPLVLRSVLEQPPIRFAAARRATEDFAFLFDCVAATRNAVLHADPMYFYMKPTHAKTVSSASPTFWLDSVEVTSELLGRPVVSSQPDLRRLLKRRLRRANWKYAYLAARADASRGRPLPAIARIARTPGAVHILGEAAWRRWRERRRRTP